MEEIKPKTIKAVGLGIIAVSILTILSNGSFSLMVNFAGGIEKMVGPDSATKYPGLYAFWNYMFIFALLMILFSFLFLIGGLFFFKINRWARIILISLSTIFSIVLVVISANLVSIDLQENLNPFNIIGVIFAALIFIASMLVLVIFLNKKQVKKYFK